MSVRKRVVAPLRSRVLDVLGRTGHADRALAIRHGYRVWRDAQARRVALRRAARLRRFGAGDPGLLLTTTRTRVGGCRAVLARRRESPVVADAIVHNLALVAGILERAGIPSRSIPIESPNRVRLTVPEAYRERFVECLAASGPATYIYVDAAAIAVARRVQHVASTPIAKLRAMSSRAPIVRVFDYQADASGVDVFGDIHGCEVEFSPSLALDLPPASARDEASAPTVSSAAFSRPPAIRTRFFDTVEFPIDVVYTWVDGDDPAWRARRARVLEIIDPESLHEEAAADARYVSRDELRYSLRSLEKYAEFVRHVYIVTDDQRPTWLRDDVPDLTVVDHREIFPADALPTFNSHSIESRLHHVPGLSEHYLYLNDDFLFARRVVASQFFHGNGVAKCFQSPSVIPFGDITAEIRPVDTAAMNGRRLVHQAFGQEPTQKFKHAPYPQLKSVHEHLEQLFPEEIARTTCSRVRSPTDLALASSLHHHVAYLLGRSVPARLATRYVDLALPNLAGRLFQLRRVRDVDTFCLNDTDGSSTDPAVTRQLVTSFLEAYFPEKSHFER